MAEQIVPTKSNLMNAKKSLKLAKLGYDLMDKKRSVLIREMMLLMDRAAQVQSQIDSTYHDAYFALRQANMTLGLCDEYAQTVPIENGLLIDYRSVMGVELPTVRLDAAPPQLYYGLTSTNSQLDEAYLQFNRVKLLTAQLAEVESCVYKLAAAIKKTQKRANALHNVLIPNLEHSIKYISEALEEKEREEFARLKSLQGTTRR